MAYLACIITNIAQSIHGKKGMSKSMSPTDFMPDWDLGKEKTGQTLEEQKQILLDIFSHIKKK